MTVTETRDDSGHAAHETPDIVYVKVAALLAFFTAIEVFTYFESVHQMSDTMIKIVLATLMVVKFVLVAAYFMHLKYDSAVLTKVFASGLVLGFPVFMVMAYALGFGTGWHWVEKVILVVVPPTVAAVWLLFSWQGGDHEHA